MTPDIPKLVAELRATQEVLGDNIYRRNIDRAIHAIEQMAENDARLRTAIADLRATHEALVATAKRHKLSPPPPLPDYAIDAPREAEGKT